MEKRFNENGLKSCNQITFAVKTVISITKRATCENSAPVDYPGHMSLGNQKITKCLLNLSHFLNFPCRFLAAKNILQRKTMGMVNDNPEVLNVHKQIHWPNS